MSDPQPQPIAELQRRVANFTGELTEEQLAELEKRWTALAASPSYARKWQRESLRHLLPRRTRLRLWCEHQRDGAAIWLCDRGRSGAAEAVWRLTGAWRKR